MPKTTEDNEVPQALLHWDRENVVALAMKLRTLHAQRQLKFKYLIQEAKLVGLSGRPNDKLAPAQQRFSRWIKAADYNDQWQLLKEAEYKAVIRYLYGKPSLWSPDIKSTNIEHVFPDSMFHATASWLNMSENSLDDIKTNFTGVYTIYRHSLHKPGYIAVGRLDIDYHHQTRAVKTKEQYHVDGSERTPASEFERTGYMFRRNSHYRIVSKETGNDELQFMYFAGEQDRQGGKVDARKVIRMTGIVSDVQGQCYYSTRFTCIRGEPKNGLETLLPKDIDESIFMMIKSQPKLVCDDNICMFD